MARKKKTPNKPTSAKPAAEQRTVKDPKRLERLMAVREQKELSSASQYNPLYSKIIKRLRIILPVLAFILGAVVLMWSFHENTVVLKPDAQTPKIAKISGQNELINPRFESTDDKDQPYTITAKKALQEGENNALVTLENPVADMFMEDGHWIAVTATQGRYEHEKEAVSLKGQVRLFHDAGYQMETEILDIDMAKSEANSDTAVYAQGPAGTLEATGLKADMTNEYLIFTGPAILTLRSDTGDNTLGGLLK